MFYSISQNNPGGSYLIDENYGIAHWVILEADNVDEAKELFQQLWDKYELETGKMFDAYCGCGICSGTRWESLYYLDQDDGTDIPMIGLKLVEDFHHFLWNELCFIHYKSGEIKKLELVKRKSQ